MKTTTKARKVVSKASKAPAVVAKQTATAEPPVVRVTADELLASFGGKVVIMADESIPPAGTPHRASWDAEHAPPALAEAAHKAAELAWRGYQVYSFGGAMLRSARISQHAGFKP